MHRKFAPLLAAALVPLSAVAAEEIDYGYVDGVIATREAPGDDFEGLGLRGSMPLAPSFFAAAEFYALSVDDLDRTDFSLGAGWHMPLNRNTDFITRLDYVRFDNELVDDDGLKLGAGVRSRVMQQLELRGAVSYVDVADGDVTVELGAQYFLSDAWAGFLEVSEGGDFGGVTIGARLDYD